MGVRVIAGSAGGRRLVVPKAGTRPMTDRVKESVFASLDTRLDDAVVLDLFAGSGSLAIEALSRGAARAVLVDRDHAAEAAVRANLATTGFEQVARFRRATVASFLSGTIAEAPFDVVFLDPPYALATAEVDGALEALATRGLVTPGATVVLERQKGSEALALPAGWEIEKERAYGDTLLVVALAG